MTKPKGGASSETVAPVGASGDGDGEEGPIFPIIEQRFVSIDEVQFKKELYPRFKSSDEIVEQYRICIDKLPPIAVNQDLILIDGFHRLAAHRQEGLEEIEAEIREVPEDEILILSAVLNAKHGKQLSYEEKKELAIQWINTFSDEKTAEILAVTERCVRNWRTQARRPQQLKEWRERQERNQRIVELAQKDLTHEEIAEEVGLGRSTVTEIIQKVGERKLSLNDNENKEIPTPDPLKVFNVWFFPYKRDDTHRFGTAYPELLEHLLHYFTEPDELIVDPMAGTGTSKEVCEKYQRKCLMYDIAPVSSEIQQNDILNGLPEEAQNCDFIYLDPPYYNNVVEDAFVNLEEFYSFIEQIAEVSAESLGPEGRVALVMADGHKHKFIPLIGECYKIFTKQGFEPIARISSPLPPPHSPHAPSMVAKAKEDRRLLYRDRVVYVFRRPES